MATVSFDATNEAMTDVTQSIPGPQEGESVFDYRARVNERLMEIVDAVSNHKRMIEKFIRERSDEKVEPDAQFFNANRIRFLTDEFEE